MVLACHRKSHQPEKEFDGFMFHHEIEQTIKKGANKVVIEKHWAVIFRVLITSKSDETLSRWEKNSEFIESNMTRYWYSNVKILKRYEALQYSLGDQ